MLKGSWPSSETDTRQYRERESMANMPYRCERSDRIPASAVSRRPHVGCGVRDRYVKEGRPASGLTSGGDGGGDAA